VVGGDFNLGAQDDNDPDIRRFVNLLSSFDMVQHIYGPTHLRGNTLDLVATFTDRVPDDIIVPAPFRSFTHHLSSAYWGRLTAAD